MIADDRHRAECFTANGGDLLRIVAPRSGREYVHRCERSTFVEVLHEIDAQHGAGFTYEQVRDSLRAPSSQVATAIAFLRERGCIVRCYPKRNMAATADVFLDGMLELCALESSS